MFCCPATPLQNLQMQTLASSIGADLLPVSRKIWDKYQKFLYDSKIIFPDIRFLTTMSLEQKIPNASKAT
jgi:hypothetical protein